MVRAVDQLPLGDRAHRGSFQTENAHPADIHDGPEHNKLQSEAGYVDARPQSRQIDETSSDARPDHTYGLKFVRGAPSTWTAAYPRIASVPARSGTRRPWLALPFGVPDDQLHRTLQRAN
jgi:hypothetical protein